MGMLAAAVLAVGIFVAFGGCRSNTGEAQAGTQPSSAASSSAKVEVEIALEDAADPWSKADGSGCANEIVRESFKAARFPVTFKVMPYSRAKDLAMKGEVAACVAMSWSPELEGKIRFPDEDKALYICRSTFLENKSAPIKVESLKDLPAGTKIGTVLNYEYPAGVTALSKQGVVFDAATSEEINLRKLALGRLDLAIVNVDGLKTVDLLVTKAEVKGKVGVVLEGFGQASHIGFSASHPSGETARIKYNEGYAAIRANGTLEKIREEWRAKYK
jgi:ABC-type amino acid transport substrate-binding protein